MGRRVLKDSIPLTEAQAGGSTSRKAAGKAKSILSSVIVKNFQPREYDTIGLDTKGTQTEVFLVDRKRSRAVARILPSNEKGEIWDKDNNPLNLQISVTDKRVLSQAQALSQDYRRSTGKYMTVVENYRGVLSKVLGWFNFA